MLRHGKAGADAGNSCDRNWERKDSQIDRWRKKVVVVVVVEEEGSRGTRFARDEELKRQAVGMEWDTSARTKRDETNEKRNGA